MSNPVRLSSVGWVLWSYAARWRFWWFGLAYTIVVASCVQTSDVRQFRYDGTKPPQVAFMALFASVLAAFAALHLRRLLSGPTAQVVPGYAVPHFVAGAIVNGLIWILVPGLVAWLGGYSLLHFFGWHALAGVTFAVVLFWPRLVLALALWPIGFFYATDMERRGAGLMIDWVYGDAPALNASAIGLAMVLYPLAAWAFWRLRDRNAELSDDLALEPIATAPGAWRSLLLRLRDAGIEDELNTRHWLLPQMHRWRTPCVTSWTQLGLILVGIVMLMASTALVTWVYEVVWFIGTISAIVLLVVPFGSWRFRARALELEFLRPVSREEFTRRFWGAMLYDFAAWTCLAIVVGLVASASLLWHEPAGARVTAVRVPLFLVAAALLLHGTGLIALRSRFWLPCFFGSVLVSVVLIATAFTYYLEYIGGRARTETSGDFVLAWFCISFAVIGLVLGTVAYLRWPTQEIR